ncbi:hypothetical protein FKP32DRAFT_1575942, partial [Trametes sanguinea]
MAGGADGCDDTSVTADSDVPFPPSPLSERHYLDVVRRWTDRFARDTIEEVGCAVCGSLVSRRDVVRRMDIELPLHILARPGEGLTRRERLAPSDPVAVELDGPILYSGGVEHVGSQRLLNVCPQCLKSLMKDELPVLSLANGRWLGEVPLVLSDLTYGEELLIARFRRNCCVGHVRYGRQGFLKANAILFEQPVTRIYNVLPPPRAELNECLAIVFTGTAKPSSEDFVRTPFIVRRQVVLDALRWLKLNHTQYMDMEISLENLAEYEDGEPAVYVLYRETQSANYDSEDNVPVYASDDVMDSAEGPCPFAIHALTVEELGEM